MDTEPLTQAYLESLTTRELIRLADIHGVDIPPGLDRIFIMEELLELAVYDMEINEEIAEEQGTKNPESAILPKQYNITFLETLVRDPLWVYAFWEIKGADREIYEKAPDFGGYFLKVTPWNRVAPDEVFTVPLAPEDNARYLGFPVNDENVEAVQRSYRVELFAARGSEDIFLAVSNPFRLPVLSSKMDKHEKISNYPLIHLSGVGEFQILRNKDRRFRTKR